MLNLDTDTIVHILDKARQFHVKEDESFPETTPDMDASYVLSHHKEDPDYQEVVDIINQLRPDQQATLVALLYIGRGDYLPEEWEEAYQFAVNELTNHTGEYLLSKPQVADFLEAGLETMNIQ